MEKKWWILIGLAVVVGLPIAWYLISPAFIVIEMNETSPLNVSEGEVIGIGQPVPGSNVTEMIVSKIISEGNFEPSAHEVAGKALLIEDNGRKVLRFEDFETINGPDLFIYLSKDLTADDFVNLGRIKATKGNINYDVDPSIDTSQYKYVLVWCRAFRVLFSYAELK